MTPYFDVEDVVAAAAHEYRGVTDRVQHSIFGSTEPAIAMLLCFLGLQTMRLQHQLTTLHERLDQMDSTAQQQHQQVLDSLKDVGTLVTGLGPKLDAVDTSVQTVENEIQTLQANNPSADYSDVLAAFGTLKANVQSANDHVDTIQAKLNAPATGDQGGGTGTDTGTDTGTGTTTQDPADAAAKGEAAGQ